jgi:hypothetical protein
MAPPQAPLSSQQRLPSMSPFSNNGNKTTNNATQSPFNSSNSNNMSSGFKQPNFTGAASGPSFGGGDKALINSNNNLVQAINKLTQQLVKLSGGSASGSGGQHAATTVGSRAGGPGLTFGGLAAGTGLGSIAMQGISNAVNSYFNPQVNNPTLLPQGKRSLQQAGLQTGINMALGTAGMFGNAAGATGVGDILRGIPFVGGLLAAPFSIAQSKAGGVAALQAANKASMLSAGQFGDIGVSSNKDLSNFTRFGISGVDAANMQIATRNAGLGRFSTQAGGQLPFGMALSSMVGLGLSPQTAGGFQALGSKLNPMAMGSNGINSIFGAAFNLGFGDQQMANFAQSMMQTQKNMFALAGSRFMGPGAPRTSELAALGLGSLDIGKAFGGDLMSSIMSKTSGFVPTKGSPYGNLGTAILENQIMKMAPGDYEAQAKLREDFQTSPLAVARQFREAMGGDITKTKNLLRQQFTTTETDTVLRSLEFDDQRQALMSSLSQDQMQKYDELTKRGIASVNVAKTLADQGIKDVGYSNTIAQVIAMDEKVKATQLKEFDPAKAQKAIETISETGAAINELIYKLVGQIGKIIEKIEKFKFKDFSNEIITEIKALPTAIGKSISKYIFGP